MRRTPVDLSRRSLLAVAWASTLWPWRARAAANDRLNVGVIGVGRQGQKLLRELIAAADVQVVAVCDVDKTRRDHGKRLTEDLYGTARRSGQYSGCTSFNDHRDLLALRDLDAVVIATPDHWHALQVIDACRARKDVYCETPVAHSLVEARLLIDAVRRSGRLFQAGNHLRSDARFRTACEHVRNGRVGKVLAVYAGLGGPPRRCELPEEAMEPGLDWDRWLGPSEMRPYHSELSPRGVHERAASWRLYREWGGGALTDPGADLFDLASWALDVDRSGPTEILPPSDEKQDRGLRLVFPGGVELVHAGAPGLTFVGTRGMVFVDRHRITGTPDKILQEPLQDRDVRLPDTAGPLRDFLDAAKTRKRTVADVESSARTAALCQLAQVGYAQRRRLRWDAQAFRFAGDDEANKALDRERRDPYLLGKV